MSRDIVEALLSEFDQEIAGTRKILECVPEDKFAWKPHEKSSTLGKLSSHVAAIPRLPAFVINRQIPQPSQAASKVELLATFDSNSAAGREALAGTSDDHLAATIPASPGVVKTRLYVLRFRVLNHLIHHRGQLIVYLRLLDVPVPRMYGPSAGSKNRPSDGTNRRFFMKLR
ncbi:DinB family protein [Candidatus Sulfopaludibacter sp. SbA3]|nr:DinB family protein [Candidatus Sulfopaludibacter sp. SbA3]